MLNDGTDKLCSLSLSMTLHIHSNNDARNLYVLMSKSTSAKPHKVKKKQTNSRTVNYVGLNLEFLLIECRQSKLYNQLWLSIKSSSSAPKFNEISFEMAFRYPSFTIISIAYQNQYLVYLCESVCFRSTIWFARFFKRWWN